MKSDTLSQSLPPPESSPVENLRVRGLARLVAPAQIKEELPSTLAAQRLVLESREVERRILRGKDQRIMVVVGPCSIHDTQAALEYASRLAKLRHRVDKRFHIIMRVYFEKPRTTVGWKGFINDPFLDDSCDLAHGIALARRLLIDILELGLPTGTEFLDPIIPQYISDLISWSAIGARTTESQTHRELASGLSMPVGFKNSTDGSVQTAINAMRSARIPHSFLGMDQNGHTSIVKTTGNPDSHIVLRGGREGSNYGPHQTAVAVELLRRANLPPAIMVDCSHSNSGKDPHRQPLVWENVLEQRAAGRKDIIGMMLESNLHSGNQELPQDLSRLRYGVSITDSCMDWEATERLLLAK
ncbi:MAG: 3-deoxy-7-phosphoheptulonate synthase [Candidatus Xiphinematobacter sp.]|nr:MAG: 3-deoxy-7-phosphoheptulonate synthase [Candidatus Xiphinematobacter sp.]